MSELITANEVIYTKLKDDTSLQTLAGGASALATRVVLAPAPHGTGEPYITIQYQSGFDVIGVGATYIMTDADYLIKAVAETRSPSVTLKAWAARIDAVLHQAEGTTVDGTVIKIWRLRPFILPELDAGRMFYHLGFFYRAHIRNG